MSSSLLSSFYSNSSRNKLRANKFCSDIGENVQKFHSNLEEIKIFQLIWKVLKSTLREICACTPASKQVSKHTLNSTYGYRERDREQEKFENWINFSRSSPPPLPKILKFRSTITVKHNTLIRKSVHMKIKIYTHTHARAMATASNQWYSFKCKILNIRLEFFSFLNLTGNTACSICVDAMTIFIRLFLFQQQHRTTLRHTHILSH